MATFNINGYDSYSGCDIAVTARINTISNSNKITEKVYSLGSIQTLSISTHQDKKPVRVIGSANAIDYTMGQRTVAGSLVFAVFNEHFATEMFNDLHAATGKTFLLPDELPALDLTISFANEYGRKSRMAIYGLRIINEGQVMSINDLYTENTYQFVANSLEPLKKNDGSGQKSNRDNSRKIVPHTHHNFAVKPPSGEEIFNKNKSNNFKEFKRVLLSVNTEQPKFRGQDGIAKFVLNPKQNSGKIIITDQLKNSVVKEIHVGEYQTNLYSVFLPTSMYSALYQNNNQVLSNTVAFTITNVNTFDTMYNDAPIIENVTETTISLTSNNPTHTTAVCVNDNFGSSIEMELKSRKCKFTNLSSETKYRLYTKLDSSVSKEVDARTLSKNENYVENFKNYVRCNSAILPDDISSYEPLLKALNNENIIDTLNKSKDLKAKELIYMAVKYKNEFSSVINAEALNKMPIKDLNNIYGNTFKFDNGTIKSNVFLAKGRKEYFESSESYPSVVVYTGKSNSMYNVVGITNEFIKSPKYSFFSFADNDKNHIGNIYSHSDILEDAIPVSYMNSKLSGEGMKCLYAYDSKDKDLDLLDSPSGYIDKEGNLIANVDYKDIYGMKNNTYYLCVSLLSESLDRTSFRKIKITDKDSIVLMSKYYTAINKNNIYCLWIEDSSYNVISNIGFVSANLEASKEANSHLANKELTSTIKEIENALKSPNSLYDIYATMNAETLNIKDVLLNLAQNMLSKSNYFDLIKQLFISKFSRMCINKDKYQSARYNRENNTISFDSNDDSQLIEIAFNKNSSYAVNVYNDNSATVNLKNNISVYYLINNNPVIKSGFVMIDSTGRVTSYSIKLEEVQ